jgi:hypothetical protein
MFEFVAVSSGAVLHNKLSQAQLKRGALSCMANAAQPHKMQHNPTNGQCGAFP